jgi:hypothetical protein
MFTYCVVSCQFPFHFTISPISFHFSHCIASFCILYFTAGMYYFIFFVDFVFLTNTYNFPSSLLCCFISLSFHCCAVPFPFHFTIVLSIFLPFYQHVILFLSITTCWLPSSHYHLFFSSSVIIIIILHRIHYHYHYFIITIILHLSSSFCIHYSLSYYFMHYHHSACIIHNQHHIFNIVIIII